MKRAHTLKDVLTFFEIDREMLQNRIKNIKENKRGIRRTWLEHGKAVQIEETICLIKMYIKENKRKAKKKG